MKLITKLWIIVEKTLYLYPRLLKVCYRPMKRLLPFLIAFLPYVGYAQFEDAKWIGSDQYMLFADYLPQFRISWTVQLDKASKSEKMALLSEAMTHV